MFASFRWRSISYPKLQDNPILRQLMFSFIVFSFVICANRAIWRARICWRLGRPMNFRKARTCWRRTEVHIIFLVCLFGSVCWISQLAACTFIYPTGAACDSETKGKYAKNLTEDEIAIVCVRKQYDLRLRATHTSIPHLATQSIFDSIDDAVAH